MLFVLCFAGLLMVYMSGYIIEITGSWETVFSILAVVNIIGVTVFIVLGDAKRVDQPQIIWTSCWKQILPLQGILGFPYLSFVTNGLETLQHSKTLYNNFVIIYFFKCILNIWQRWNWKWYSETMFYITNIYLNCNFNKYKKYKRNSVIPLIWLEKLNYRSLKCFWSVINVY